MATETSFDWQSLVGEYTEGASDVEIACILKITMKRFYQLIEENQSFAEFTERGRTLSRAWWESRGRKNLFNKDFNTTLWNFNMKNRYGWADKVDTNDTTDKEPVDRDKMAAELSKALARLSKNHPELLKGIHLIKDGNDEGT